MSTDITLSSAVRSNLLSLQNTASLLGKTQEKLATGLKVNSALDDPTAFFTASALNSRASDLNRLQDFVGNAVQTLKAADEGISAITNLVESAEATARQAIQSSGSTFTAVQVTGSSTVTADTAPTVQGSNIGSDAELDATGLNFDNTDTIEINLNGTTSIINFENNGNGVDATAASGDNYYINLDDADGATGAAATTTGIALAGDQQLKTDLGFAAGDTLDITENGVTYTIHFEEGGAGVDPTADSGTDLYLNLDDSDGSGGGTSEVLASDLAAKINAIAGLNSNFSGGNQLTIGADANNGDVTIAVSDADGGGAAADEALFDALGFTSNTNGSLTVEPGNSGDATVSTLASVINGITGLSSSFSGGNQLTIASSSFVGDLTITVKDSGTADDTKLNALGLTNTGTAGITLVEPGNVDLSSLTGDLTIQLGTGVGIGAVNTITFGTDDSSNEVNTRAELLTEINNITGISASFVGDALQLDVADSEQALTIGGGSNVLTALHLTAGINYPPEGTANTNRTNFAAQYDELRSQIDQLVKDAGFNGVNLLDGDSLTVTFNEDGTSTLGVSGVTFSSSGLGIDAAENNFQLDININDAITELSSATATLRSQASKFGSNLSVVETRQDFTKNLINVLETGAANLTLADTNEEGANLLALQTRQQLSSTALSLASQADQNVLRLF